jgi:hypothetical protein
VLRRGNMRILPEWVQKIKDRADNRLKNRDVDAVTNYGRVTTLPPMNYILAMEYKDIPRLIEIASEMAKHLMFVLRLMKMHSGCSDLDCLECKYRVDDEDGPCFGFEIAQTMQKWNGLL